MMTSRCRSAEPCAEATSNSRHFSGQTKSDRGRGVNVGRLRWRTAGGRCGAPSRTARPSGNGDDATVLLFPDAHIAREKQADGELGFERLVRQLGIAGAQDDVLAKLPIELGLESGLDVDFGEHTESLGFQRCVDGIGASAVCCCPPGDVLMGRRGPSSSPRGRWRGMR